LVFLSAFAGEMQIKIHVMQKQLRIITSRRLAVCPLSSSCFPVPFVPASVFSSRHLRRYPVAHSIYPSVGIFHLPFSGWYIWCYPSGPRQLAALPF